MMPETKLLVAALVILMVGAGIFLSAVGVAILLRAV